MNNALFFCFYFVQLRSCTSTRTPTHIPHLAPPTSQQPRSTEPFPSDAPSPAVGAVADFRSAMAELDSLRLAAVDPRDEERYARPQTAAGSIGGGWGGAGAGVGAAGSAGGGSAGGAGGVAAAGATAGQTGGAIGGEENAEDLKLRLNAAEAVMRKLYRRNNQLEEEARHKESLPPRPQTAAARSTHEAGVTDADLNAPPVSSENSVDPLAGADEQALFLLQQKEADLQQMRDYTTQLQERLQSVAALQVSAVDFLHTLLAPALIDQFVFEDAFYFFLAAGEASLFLFFGDAAGASRTLKRSSQPCHSVHIYFHIGARRTARGGQGDQALPPLHCSLLFANAHPHPFALLASCRRATDVRVLPHRTAPRPRRRNIEIGTSACGMTTVRCSNLAWDRSNSRRR